eukprot:CAMPEP_0118656596 /NCGR_PEP_ID=MMETSP0785-20121206/13570_1 /TAXON_ID=91992 /ORGANISM="Bolidomonas pacifica, Strain CCMP 1866" /LENGTH=792 /DNA_ID=CAMNT_0006549459 /DNA_START=119 /DNA_END=2493 /DNA_ORIENTATION=-
MELDLSSSSLLTVRPCPHKQTMALVPPSKDKKSKHKLVIGESSGRVSLYEFKRGEINKAWTNESLLNSSIGGSGGVNVTGANDMTGGEEETARQRLGSMFSKNSSSGSTDGSNGASNSGITSLTLGGAGSKNDKIFVSNGSKVIGLSKKGKPFFTLTSNSSESIEQILVKNSSLWCRQSGGGYQKYVNGAESEFYQVAEGVNWIEYESLTSSCETSETHDALLGCQDRSIRVVRDGENISTLGVDVCVTSLGCIDKNNEPVQNHKRVVFGTSSGTVAMLRIDGDGAGSHGWAVPSSGKSKGMVNVLTFSDISHDGVDDIVVGWEDGTVSVLGFDISPDMPQSQFSVNIGESISSVQCGRVSNADYDEIVCLGFAGKVISFTNEPLHTKDTDDKHGRTHATINNENKIRSMKKELEEMEDQIKTKKTLLATKEKNSSDSDAIGVSADLVQAFEAKTIFTLDEAEAAYLINVEIPLEMNLVLLTSSVSVDLLDSETSNATVSRSTPAEDSGLKLSACYRMVEGGSRLQMKVRTTEGEYGEISATIVGASTPHKSAVVVKFPVKPLSLHCRAAAFRPDEESRQFNTLTLRGTFSINVAHEWVRACLPEIPPYQPSPGNSESRRLYFRNVFTGSVLEIVYDANLMTLKSDNLSTLAIFKECVSRESTKRRVHVSDSVDVNEDSIPNFLGLLHNRLQHLLSLSRQVEIIEAIKEINTAEAGDNEWMSPEYREILKNADQIRKEHKMRPMIQNYLCGIITDLFVDRHKLRGIDVKHKIPDLQAVIYDYDGERLLSMFS